MHLDWDFPSSLCVPYTNFYHNTTFLFKNNFGEQLFIFVF